MIDLHCHILPGFGDGPPTMREALAMARQAVVDGITAVVATPHFYGVQHIQPFHQLPEAVSNLQAAIDGEGIPLRIHAGAEVLPSQSLIADIKSGVSLTLAQTRYLLLEMPLTILPAGLSTVVYNLQLEGYRPILAHPERVLAFQQHQGSLEALVQKGLLLQVNAGSFLGVYGRNVRKAAISLLRRQCIHVISSDAHDTSRRRFNLTPAYQIVSRLSSPADAHRLLETHPTAIIDGGR
ncbi:MAG: tyrosine-protein phosphatase [Armatimonadota bacterium]